MFFLASVIQKCKQWNVSGLVGTRHVCNKIIITSFNIAGRNLVLKRQTHNSYLYNIKHHSSALKVNKQKEKWYDIGINEGSMLASRK
jgi:hypothetical protein